MFVAVSDNKFAWSKDGKTITEGAIDLDRLKTVCYGNNMFVAVGDMGHCME